MNVPSSKPIRPITKVILLPHVSTSLSPMLCHDRRTHRMSLETFRRALGTSPAEETGPRALAVSNRLDLEFGEVLAITAHVPVAAAA
jgi:hypothetical protein